MIEAILNKFGYYKRPKNVKPTADSITWNIGWELNDETVERLFTNHGFEPLSENIDGYDVSDLGFVPRIGDTIIFHLHKHLIVYVNITKVVWHGGPTYKSDWFDIYGEIEEIFDKRIMNTIYIKKHD